MHTLYISIGLQLAALWAARAPLKKPDLYSSPPNEIQTDQKQLDGKVIVLNRMNLSMLDMTDRVCWLNLVRQNYSLGL